MFGFAKHNLRALTLLSLALFSTLSHAEGGYPGRQNGFASNDPMYDYSAEIQKNKSRMAQQGGESDAAYNERMSHLYTEFTAPPVAKDDVASGQGTVDRAEKLKDAQRFAGEGFYAASAQSTNMTVAALSSMSTMLGNVFDPNVAAQATADMAAYNEAAQKYGAIAAAMQSADVHNGNGATRLRYDAQDEKYEGKGVAPSPTQVEAVLAKMTDEQKQKLEARGVNPENLVERLLSGEIDTTDPNAVLRALNDTRQLSTAELAEVKELAEAKIADGTAGPELAAGAGSELGGGSEVKETHELVSASEKSGKGEEKDPSKVTTPGLAGIAIRLINREVMGYRLSDFLGKGQKTASAPTAGRGLASQTGAANGEAPLKKHLTAMDFYDLQGHGITAPRHGNNIFKMAHRQFRDYSKWRDQPQPTKGRVALAH